MRKTLKQRDFGAEIIDFGSLKLIIKWEETLHEE
jgi:hypothetical protein